LIAVMAMVATIPALATSGGFDGIPAAEQRIDAGLPTVGARDGVPVALSSNTGEVCTLAIENFTLRRILTGTGHATPDEAIVYDASRTFDFLAAQADGLRASVALLVEGIDGGWDILALSTADLCSSWSAPVTVVGPGSTTGRPSTLEALDRNSIGTLALLFSDIVDSRLHLVTSIDHGATWTTPLSVFAATSGPDVWTEAGLDVDKTGRICVGYVEPWSVADPRLYTARSLDGGLTLGDEASVGFTNRVVLDFAFADQSANGRLLLFVTDTDSSFTDGNLNIEGSGTGTPDDWCAGWSHGFDFPLGLGPVHRPSIGKSRFSDDHVLVGQLLADGSLAITSTANGGIAWQPLLVLAADATLAPSVVRTDDGSWTVVWETVHADPDVRYLTDIWAITSTDDGATFNPPVKIDDTPTGTTRAALGHSVAADGDNVAIPYQQFTGGGRGTDLHLETGAATALGAAGDPRIDGDSAPVTVAADPFISIGANDAGQVFVAFTALDTGPHPDLFVARSDDGGYTFGTPTRIGHGAPGAFVHRDPIVAMYGSNVYVGFSWFDGGTAMRHIAWRASNDLGASWPHEVDLGSFSWIGGNGTQWPYNVGVVDNVPTLNIAAWSDSLVYAAYTDGANVLFAASTDAGATLSIIDNDIDQTGSLVRQVDMCVLGGDIVLTYTSSAQAYALISGNEGASWDPRVPLLASPNLFADAELTCGQSRAIVTYTTSAGEFGWRTFAPPSWLPEGTLSLSPGSFGLLTSAAILDASTVVAAFDEGEPQGGVRRVYATRSTDGGVTFEPPQRLDAGGLVPASTSGAPVVAVPETGPSDVHVYWSETGSGSRFEPVISRSTDAGMSWDAPLRMGQGSVCEGVLPTSVFRDGNVASSGSATLLAWMGQRDSATGDVLVNAFDGDDLDRDGAAAAVDCAPEDPSVFPGAAEVADGIDNQCPGDPGFGDVDEVPAGALFDSAETFAWPELPGTTLYRVVRSTSVAFDAGCVTEETANAFWVDPDQPGPGELFHYVVQAIEPFEGSFGSSSDGTGRVVPCVTP